MHIPSGETALLELIRFDGALETALAPSPDYEGRGGLSDPNTNGQSTNTWLARGVRRVICVGGDPSTASLG